MDGAKAAYEQLLSLIGRFLGNHHHASTVIVRDTAEEIIATLKDPDLCDLNRHESISRLLTGKLPSDDGGLGLSREKFTELVKTIERLDDYECFCRSKESDILDKISVRKSDKENDREKPESRTSDLKQGAVQLFEKDKVEAPIDNNTTLEDADEDRKLLQDAFSKKVLPVARLLTVNEIDAHFVERELSRYYDKAAVVDEKSAEILRILDLRRSGSDLIDCEKMLFVLLGGDLIDTIKLFLFNRIRIWAGVSMKRARTDHERNQIEQVLIMEETGEGKQVLQGLHSKCHAVVVDPTRSEQTSLTTCSLKTHDSSGNGVDGGVSDCIKVVVDDPMCGAVELDLESLAFCDDESRRMSKWTLPDKSWREMKEGYEEVNVPAAGCTIPRNETLVEITTLPKWTQKAFSGMHRLNRVQSKMCDFTLRRSQNILMCAPNGIGKTNVACLAMLNILGQYRKENIAIENINNECRNDDEERDMLFDLRSFKMVYLAPKESLAQEVVKHFSERLQAYGVVVRELLQDSCLTIQEQQRQLAESQLLVTTPENWDIITRQRETEAHTQLVKLFIMDEIQLLLLDKRRGPLVENIVARVIHQAETTAKPIRLVGLSTNVANYADVATFLRVQPDTGLFVFNQSHRRTPLQMQYIGITEQDSVKRVQLEKEICYEKALLQRELLNQILIFVHSPKETVKTAQALRDMALEREDVDSFVRNGGASQEILREEASNADNAELKDVLPCGFAIYHEGLGSCDQELVEDLFAGRHIGVLCCTATVAWGVKLSAHAVIIRGTQIYDPAKGCWTELCSLDASQMIGCAGRPLQYDRAGEAIILTGHSELPYYSSLTNSQVTVESQLLKSLPDYLNTEIALGTVQSIAEAVARLSYTFLYVRMLRDPELYGISNADETLKKDPTLGKMRLDLLHTAALILERNGLIQYDRKTGTLHPTPMGRISGQFQISHLSMAEYSRHMSTSASDCDILHIFSLSREFAHITVREEEKLELAKLSEEVRISSKENLSKPSTKISILLQAYISRLKPEGGSLTADMAYIGQSGARILRAMFEIALIRKWASLARLCLNMSNMVVNRIWQSESPIRQFKNVPEAVASKLEQRKDTEWPRYHDLTPTDLGELIGVPRLGRVLHKLVHHFPRLQLSAQLQSMMKSMLRVELTVVPSFNFDVSVHGHFQLFHVIVEDENCEIILHHQVLSLRNEDGEKERALTISIPVVEPLSSTIVVRVISDRWLHSETKVDISFDNITKLS